MSLNAVSEDIRTLLGDNSKGVSGTDLFSFQWGSAEGGEEVDSQILIIDTDGIDSPVKDEIEQPVFIIYVRGGTNEGVKSVHDRARDIYEFMITEPTQFINSTEYLQFAPVGGLVPLGKDASNRFGFSMNFFTYRQSVDA